MAKGKWIQSAIKHPGALTRKAKKMGGVTKSGTIKVKTLNKLANSKNVTTRRQANLAKTLRKINK